MKESQTFSHHTKMLDSFMYITVKGIFELTLFFSVVVVDTPLNFKTLNFMPKNIFQNT